MSIRYETDGPVAIVTVDRPDVANAVDRPTAEVRSGASTPTSRSRSAERPGP